MKNIYTYNTVQFQEYILKNKLYINTLAMYMRENSSEIACVYIISFTDRRTNGLKIILIHILYYEYIYLQYWAVSRLYVKE